MEEKSVFLRIFGDTPILRVMNFLVVNEDFDYSKTDIAKHTRDVGKAKMYQLNLGNPAVKKFRHFFWEIVTQYIESQHLGKCKKNKVVSTA